MSHHQKKKEKKNETFVSPFVFPLIHVNTVILTPAKLTCLTAMATLVLAHFQHIVTQ